MALGRKFQRRKKTGQPKVMSSAHLVGFFLANLSPFVVVR